MNHRYSCLICVLTGSLFICYGSALALQSVVPETGQTSTYGTGDDGALKPGLPWPASRFSANSNGTVTDNLTGLIWLQNASCSATLGGIVKTTTLTWANALTWSNALSSGYCGLTDGSTTGEWRLPNRKEFQSLMDASKYGNVLPPFMGIQGYNWSSSTCAGDPTLAWMVNGWSFLLNRSNKSNSYFVWPVRGGQFGNAVMSALPASGGYGPVAVGGSSSQSVTVSNSAAGGSSRLQINAIALRGPDPSQFSINPGDGTSGTCGVTPTLAPGTSCTVAVSFNPTALGVKNATLRVSGSDVNAPNIDITLTGIGVGYNITGSVSGGNGTISSINPVSALNGSTATFTLAPSATYRPASSVTGTCATGSWSGNTYTTGTVIADCNVGFSFTKITYPLTITFQGSGGGTVAVLPKPPAVDCTSTCSQSFDIGTAVTLLMPTVVPPNVFSGWQGCSSSYGDCTITMSGAKSVSALFNSVTGSKVKMNGNEYGVIVGFYDTVPDDGEISLKAGDFYEVVDFSILNNKRIVLKGGYNADFSAVIGTSIIHGPVTILSGTVTFDNIVIM